MKQFVKWFLLAILLLLLGVITDLIKNDSLTFVFLHIKRSLFIIGIGAFILAIFFVLVTRYYIPKRKAKLNKQIIKVFKARQLQESLFCFSIHTGFDCYIELTQDIRMTMNGAYNEQLIFYLPEKQLSQLSIRPEFKYELVILRTVQAKGFKIHQAPTFFMKNTREKVIRKIRSIRR